MSRPSPVRPSRAVSPAPPVGLRLGRDGFASIRAVEGIALTPDMLALLDRFERDGLSADERRRAIISRFAPPR